MAAESQDILIPIGPIPVDKEKRGIALPSEFGEVLQPHLSQRPIYLPSAYAIENNEDFLQAVGWCGERFGAVHLRFLELEEDEFWWNENKNGSISMGPKQRFETRMQTLVPHGIEGSNAFRLTWTMGNRNDKRGAIARWAEALKDKEHWQMIYSKELLAKELEGSAMKGKPYGVDTSVQTLNAFIVPLYMVVLQVQFFVGMLKIITCTVPTIKLMELQRFDIWYLPSISRTFYTINKIFYNSRIQ
ncbi:hypothetical protein BDD12DRAFT_810095 [Trichophaea hybrida]|nr:hypothetical protein BDD12DRAFT_810095 [Trichophaea hybrida]